MTIGRNWFSFVFALTLAPLYSIASDGIFEINDVCATNSGCFEGDTAGYPVTITERGSYKLTSNLFPPDIHTSAIEINENDVTLDLAGFVILFPGNGCLSSGNCPQGAGSGINGDGSRRTTVSNGLIKNAGQYGVRLSDMATVDAIRVDGCGEDGIRVNPRGIVSRSHVNSCGNFGANLGGNTTFSNNVFAFNNKLNSGGADRTGGEAGVGNICADGSCNQWGLRRYFLTLTSYTGGDADEPSTCGSGFQFASVAELNNPTELDYDESLGRISGDSGGGPPGVTDGEFAGWIRSGQENSVAFNCQGWASSADDRSGMRLNWKTTTGLPTRASGWERDLDQCDNLNPVWCIER